MFVFAFLFSLAIIDIVNRSTKHTIMKTRHNFLILIISIPLLLIPGLYFQNNFVSEAAGDSTTLISASIPSGFYKEDLLVEISAPEDTEVYYTEDGSFPSRDNANSILYEEAISLPCYDELTVYTLKVVGYTEESVSPVETYTYFTDTNIANRFDTLVVNISGSDDDFYGYDNGILVEGKARDEYLAANPDIEEAEAKDPAGYNLRGLESERPVTVQVFDSNGADLLTQHCGIRVSGNYTRGKNQKSLQLFARSSYDEHGTFHVSLFPEIRTKTDGTILQRNNRLQLRNSGDDFNHGFIRDSLVHSLAKDYNFPLTYVDKPACVFLNGQYQGFYWIREPYQNGYMENMYGSTDGEFVTIALNEYEMSPVEDADETKRETLKEYTEEYQDIYDTYSFADFNDDAVFSDFCKLVDVENYLQYYAIELYIGNKDWPYNNVKAYKYVPNDEHALSELNEEDYMPFNGSDAKDANICDGRYRYLLFDSDYSFYLQDRYTSYSYSEDNMAILSNNAQSPIFSNLMTRQDCRSYFINVLCDLMNDSFSYRNIEKTVTALDDSRRSELEYFLTNSDAPDESASVETVAENIEAILEFAENRPESMHTFIQSDFPVSTPYTITVDMPKTATLSINTLEQVSDGFEGNYYANCGLTLCAKTDIGHSFADFTINGKHFNTNNLSLTEEDLLELLQGGTELSVNIIVDDSDITVPVLYTLDTEDDNDEIVFYNPSGHEVSTKGLYITDDAANLRKTAIPAITLAAGESFTMYGRKNQSSDASFKPRMGFNLRTGETLIISDSAGNIISQLTIPDMQNDGSVYQLDLFSGSYYEVNKNL